MKKLLLALLLFTQVFNLVAQSASDEEDPPRMVVVFGPRLGAAYSLVDPAEYSAQVNELLGTTADPGNYYPITSIFGINVEYRILLGDSKDHFAFQGLFVVNGMEQSVFLPAMSIMIGYRHHSGFEMGAGPIASLAGFGVLGAIGYTFSFNGVYVPVDVSFQIPNNSMYGCVTLTTGFNFMTD
jgi:hypothetical protein